MLDGGYWPVLLTLGSVVLPLLLAWFLIALQARKRHRRGPRR